MYVKIFREDGEHLHQKKNREFEEINNAWWEIAGSTTDKFSFLWIPDIKELKSLLWKPLKSNN